MVKNVSENRRPAPGAQADNASRTDVLERLAYRPREIAAMVGLSPRAIYRAIARGELSASRVARGTRLLVPAVAAEEWLSAHPAAIRGTTPAVTAVRTSRGERPLRDAFRGLPESQSGS